MRYLYSAFLVLLFILVSCGRSGNEILLLNDGWKFAENGTLWQDAEVPGTVQADLLNLNLIPDPFIKNNEDSIQWVSTKNWSYRKEFSVPKKTLDKQKHILNFAGLDTYAKIYFNDSLILSANNAFRNWEVDVSNLLKMENLLLVEFENSDSVEKEKVEELSYTLPEDARVFSRKPQYQSGWDWGPTIKTMGIWRDVTLLSFDNARIQDVYLETKSINNSMAQITAHIEIESFNAENLSLRLRNKTTDETFSKEINQASDPITLPFNIEDPQLWWTHNLGDPFLYDLQFELIYKGTVLETKTIKYGIRTIELVTEKDSIGQSFYFKLNGKPVYMKGANYIPQLMIRPKVDQEKYSQLIEDAVLANMNMLRVWGGGIYEDDYFYTLCDEKGILVWQDFMFAGGMYPSDIVFLQNIKQEAIDNVKRLRNHPSLALWCGNNEISEGWARWGWKDGREATQIEEITRGYNKIFNEILPQVVDSLNPDIDYWESSPKYGRGDKRYQFEGDAHDWWVWHDGYPFEHYDEEVPRFMSEFGFQSFPSVETIKHTTQRDSVLKNDPLFVTHQKHKRGFQIIDEYMERDFPMPKNGEDYVYVSQLLQAYGISRGIHAHRRAKPYNMGTLYWQLNDLWPVVSWSSIDYLGNWKALHYEAKKSFQNILISTEEKNDSVAVFVINDNLINISDTLHLELLNFDGQSIFQKKIPLESKADTSLKVFTLPLTGLSFSKSNTVLKISFADSEYLHYFVKPKEMKLQRDTFDLQIKKEIPSESKIRKGQRKNKFSITLTSRTLQKNLFLRADSHGRWSDNFFDLLPNQPKTIYFYTKSNNPPKLKYQTLNLLVK